MSVQLIAHNSTTGKGQTLKRIINDHRLHYSTKCFLIKLLFGLIGLLVLYEYWHRPLPSAILTDVSLKSLNLRNETAAQTMEREVRILCWVMTTPKYHKKRAIHVNRTWGKRCNRIIFVTSEPDDELNTLVVPVEDTYERLWGKVRAAFRYIYQHYRDEADWFLKADDDTYVFVENLRYLLYPYSPDMPVHFGHPFHLQKENTPFMSGGSGYVLSREALRRFVEISMDNATICKEYNDIHYHEDVEIGACLDAVGVIAPDSRDSKLRLRFYPFEAYSSLTSIKGDDEYWFNSYSFYRFHNHRGSLSPYAAAFHYIGPEEMYVYDFMNYEFNAFGLSKTLMEELPEKLKWEEVAMPPSDN